MELMWIDADNRAILFVHPGNLKGDMATKDDIVIEFVP